MEALDLLQCPISKEPMNDPVTIATGVTYERKNIEKWLFKYKKNTCPATMQHLPNFELAPNHTLKSLITSLARTQTSNPSSQPSTWTAVELDNLDSLLASIETSPFKLRSLRKLRSVLECSNDLNKSFVSKGGIETLHRIMHQALSDPTDFAAFQACEEAVGVLDVLPLTDVETVELLTGLECTKTALQVMIQRGSAEARISSVSILIKVSRIDSEWANNSVLQSDPDTTKSLLDVLSDDFATKLSSSSLDLLIQVSEKSVKSRVKMIESGAVSVLIELLPDCNKCTCEKTLLLLKRMCELSEGRLAFGDHRLGIASVSKRILRVSEPATKLGVKILWLMCSYSWSERVLDDMMGFGAVRKLLALIHFREFSSTKDKAIRIIKMHSNYWRNYPCFPCELQEFLRLKSS